ncbi:ABC transporter permease [Nocardioides endophyticus]
MTEALAKPTNDQEPSDASAGGVRSTAVGVTGHERLTRSLDFVSRWAVVGGFVLLVLYFAIRTPDTFLTPDTLRTVLDQAAVPLILVVGLTIVLAVGEFDLAYTSVVGFSGAVVIVLMSREGWPVPMAVAAALAGGAIAGLAIGLVVSRTSASSFIVTLAVGSVLTGVELSISDNTTIYQNVPESFRVLTRNEILTVRWPVWAAALTLVVAWLAMHRTRFGRHVYAVGQNRTASFLAGVPVRRLVVIAFVVMSVLSVLAALILTSRSASYYPNASQGLLLNTYAAAFLGAAASRRARFSVLGSALGVLWIVTLQVGLTLMNESTALVNLIQGAVLAAAVLLAARGKRA